MNLEASDALIDEMHDLLEKERAALVRGDLTCVTALFDRKEKLVQMLGDLRGEHVTELHRIQNKIFRNQKLIDGALQGIRHVSARLAALRKVEQQLETYGEDGQRHTIDGYVVHKVEKRA